MCVNRLLQVLSEVVHQLNRVLLCFRDKRFSSNRLEIIYSRHILFIMTVLVLGNTLALDDAHLFTYLP